MTRLRPAAAVLAVFALAGWAGQSCRGRAPVPADVACAPVDGPLAAGTRADALAGEFRLTMVAVRGAQAGQSATGRLTLRPYGSRPAPVPASATARYPLFGATEVELAAVGAVAPGELARADAARPGVLVMEWSRDGSQQVTLRLGADANAGGSPRFDGSYTALTVTAASPQRFAGTWESGAGEPQAAGYFCADRTR